MNVKQWPHASSRLFPALFVVALLFPSQGLAASAAQSIDIFPMSLGLLGGLALFLYGMDKMSIALKRAAGDRMRTLLAKLTSNRIMGVLTGTGLTALIQSSSVTTVLVVGFISAGLMTLPQSVGVIMGANIGTTVTAQIIAFKVTKAALAMVALGFLIQFVAKKESWQHYGNMLFGLGLIFLGMNMMGDAMTPLRSYEPFIQAMADMDNLLLAVLLALLFTALVQSSSACIGIVIVMAGQGFIPLETGIALTMGAHIGTCITAMLAAIGKPREAIQAAAIHVSFNVFGVLLWFPLIAVLGQISMSISPISEHLTGMSQQAADIPRQIANANTLFSVLNTLLMLPFSGLLIWFVRKIIPFKAKPVGNAQIKVRPKYLADELLTTPDLALAQAQLEIGRVGRRVCNMMHLLPSLASNSLSHHDQNAVSKQLKEIEGLEDEVDRLHVAILSYLGRLRMQPLSDLQSSRQIKLISMTDMLEGIADLVIETMVPLAYRALNKNMTISPMMRNALDTAQERVNQALLDCVNAIRRDDKQLAEQVLKAKRELNAIMDRVLSHQAERLIEQDDRRIQLFRVEMEWVESLKRIYTLSKRISKLQLRERSVQAES